MSDDVPGDYHTVEGIAERAEHFDNPMMVELVRCAKGRVAKFNDGYVIEPPEDAAPDSLAMIFHFGILTGAALEREYPASIDGGDGQ